MIVEKKKFFSFDSITSENLIYDIALIIDRVDIIPLNDSSLLILADAMAELYLNDKVDLSSCVINILNSVYSKNIIFNLPFKSLSLLKITIESDDCNDEIDIKCDLECQIKKLSELLTVNTLEEFHNEFIKFKEEIGDRDIHEDVENRISKLHDAFNVMVRLTHE